MRVKHTRSDMPKPILDAPMEEVLSVTLNSSLPKEWRCLKRRQTRYPSASERHGVRVVALRPK